MNYKLLLRHAAQAFLVGCLAAWVASGTNLTFGVVKACVVGGVVAAARVLIETLSPPELVKAPNQGAGN